MAENPLKQNTNPEPPEEGFVTKPLDTPILGSQTRDTLAAEKAKLPASAGFYESNKWYIWAVALGLSVIAVLSYFAFRSSPASPNNEAKVDITVDAPQTIASGGEIVYKIRVENKDSQKLVGQQLELTYPTGFAYVSSSPKAQNLSGTSFVLPDLVPGQNVVAIIKAKTSGSINDEKELKITLRYKFGNSNLPFSKEQKYAIRLVAAQISLDITGPQSTNNAQLVTYEIAYKNSSTEPLTNARLKLTLPDGFSYASAQPEPDLGNNIWNLPDLQPGAEGKVALQGSYKNSSPGESKTLAAELLVLSDNGDYFTQNTASFMTQLSSLPLLVTQELTDAVADNVVKPGDQLHVLVKYQNNASVAARGVSIQVQLDSKALDYSSIRAEGGVVSNSSITWNASGVPQLETINPSEQGSVSFTVSVKNPATKDSSKNLIITSASKIKSAEYETYFPGNQLTFKVYSPVQLSENISYVSGSQPPQAGKSTSYKVNLSFKNASNDYSNTQVSLFLPLGSGSFITSSVNAAESGKVQFDPATGKLTWNVGQLPAHSGVFSQARTLEFQVVLNASAAQVGQAPVLVKNITFSAFDTFTNQQVTGSAEDLSTSDVEDAGYSGGTVVN